MLKEAILCSNVHVVELIQPTTAQKSRVVLSLSSADERGRQPVQFTRVWSSRKGPGAPLFCICFCLPLLYHYLSPVHSNPFRTSPKSLCNCESFRFSVRTFSRSATCWVVQAHFSLSCDRWRGTSLLQIRLNKKLIHTQKASAHKRFVSCATGTYECLHTTASLPQPRAA